MNRGHRERRVLDTAGDFRAMTGVMAIMLFLTLLAAAMGLATAGASRLLDRQLAGRLTVQVVDGDSMRRDVTAARAAAILRQVAGVTRVQPVDHAALARLLAPWLGSDGADPELPVPAMIDVDLAAGGDPGRVRAALAPLAGVRVDAHESWMSPVSGVLHTMVLLAIALVALMTAATAAVIVLAARAGLETHRATIEVMHMLGSTDVQVARLFQRRLARDAAIGGAIGGIAAVAVILLVGTRLAALGSELLGNVTLATGDWVVLALLPPAYVLLATIVARVAVVTRLRRTL
ncbi:MULTISPECIES: permease [unclassified Sphingomonas]|uniref:cell division protein FtsX n=1 Tax=unclassified Sphingomonas TaxID=196159 RepID=UPI00226A2BE8|nr:MULTISPECIES: permease [unclassified Sphingomonas]